MGAAGGGYMDNYTASINSMQQMLRQSPTQVKDPSDPSFQAARASQILTTQLARGRSSAFTYKGPSAIGDGAPVADKTLLGS